MLIGNDKGNVYIDDFNSTNAYLITCLLCKASKDESWMCYKKSSQLNFKTMNELIKRDLVRGILKFEFSKYDLCDACQDKKQKSSFFKSKKMFSIL